MLLMVESFLKYLSFEKRYSKHTLEAYQTDLTQYTAFLKLTFEIENVIEANHSHLRGWIVSLMEEGISSRSVNRKIATLKSFYKYLLGREYIDTNPATKLKPLKTDKELPSFLKEEEIMQLLDNVQFSDDFSGKRDRLIFELFYSTGIRLAELTGLKISDVNFFDKTIKVLGKRNKERIIPLSDSLIIVVRDYLEIREELQFESPFFLLTDDGNEVYAMFIQRIVKKYLGAVTSLSKKSPHVLRHTFATHLLNKGADLNAVKDLLGHTSLAATQVYTHNSIEKLKAVFDQAHPKA